MPIDIKPVRDESFNCIYSILATICNYYQIEYNFMFVGLWGFNFNFDKELKVSSLGKKIDAGVHNMANSELLEKCVGIKLHKHSSLDYLQIIKLIKSEFVYGRPVIISSDLFWCPWNQAYQKYYFAHYYLVIGLKEISNELICVDPYLLNNIECLSGELFLKGFKECLTYELINEKTQSYVNFDLIYNTINHVNSSNIALDIFNKIRGFADVVGEYLDFSIESEGYDDIFAIPLFDNLKNIVSYRKSFIKFLDYMKQNSREFGVISESMKQVAEQWESVRLNLMRLSMKPNYKEELGKCKLKIRKIADLEEEVSYKILSIINNK